MNWHINMNEQSLLSNASCEAVAEGGFVPSYGMKIPQAILTAVVNTTKLG